jgi:hypothetical protein
MASFSLGTPVPFTNKSDRHNIAEILLKHHKPNETKSTGVKSMKKKHPLLWD